MDNVGLMAIVDAGEDLLHENGTVTFAEFATLQNLIEELTTLADSERSEKVRVSQGCHGERRLGYLLCNKVVAFLIFKELVHFDDVGVVL